MKTAILRAGDPQTAPAAARILREGGLVALPTETVYGLGANGLDEQAVKKIFEAKGRPQDNPLILHIAGAQQLADFCREIPDSAYRLAEAFWPGPLTMVLPVRENVPARTTAGLDTVAIRCPATEITRRIIELAGVPIAAPSANTSGRPSTTTAQHVLEDLAGKIEVVVDGGPCGIGVESTILDLTVRPARLLRPGGLPVERIEQVIGKITVDPAVLRPMGEGERPRAPGMKYRHYAPRAQVTVLTGDAERTAAYIAEQAAPGSGVICFSEYAGRFAGRIVRQIGSVREPLQQAQSVFDALRSFDETDVTEIYAQCPEEAGLGLAVANRLKKAAGFHVVAL